MSKIKLLEFVNDERIKILGAEDLQLDRIPALIYPEDTQEEYEKRNYAVSVLRAPLSKPENISHRREIARDFLSSDALLEKLEAISGDAQEYRKIWQEDRRALIAQRHQEDAVPAGGSINAGAGAKLEMVKLNLTRFLELSERLGSLIDLLASYTLYAEGLLEFKETCIRLYASYAFSDVPRAKRLLSADVNNFTAELLLGLNENLSVESVSLNMLYTARDGAGKDADISDADNSVPSIDGLVSIDSLIPLLLSSIDALNDHTVEACEELIGLFSELSSELKFYRFCYDFCKKLGAAGAKFIFPQVTEAESAVTSILALRDPLEVLSGEGFGAPHDILLTPERSGIVVTGPGGVGKTALLRAVCTAQILAQCGLPVICRDASLSVKSGIFVCFTDVSDPERDPLRRFESEAQAIAKIIDSLTPYALVALNELFETVNFADASDALYNIFSVMTQHNIAFFATTHMPRLAERFIEVDRITAMSMSGSSRLEPMNTH